MEMEHWLEMPSWHIQKVCRMGDVIQLNGQSVNNVSLSIRTSVTRLLRCHSLNSECVLPSLVLPTSCS